MERVGAIWRCRTVQQSCKRGGRRGGGESWSFERAGKKVGRRIAARAAFGMEKLLRRRSESFSQMLQHEQVSTSNKQRQWRRGEPTWLCQPVHSGQFSNHVVTARPAPPQWPTRPSTGESHPYPPPTLVRLLQNLSNSTLSCLPPSSSVVCSSGCVQHSIRNALA